MLSSVQSRSVRIFYSYAHEDIELRAKLARYLRRSDISDWYDRDILPGQKWENEIDTFLEKADIILLLVSVDFIDSDYCYGKEMTRALELSQQGKAVIIPVILRPAPWQATLLNQFQALPADLKPVMSRLDHEEAFLEVATGIRKRINDILMKGYMVDAEVAKNEERYEDASFAYSELIRLFPQNPSFHKERSDLLLLLGNNNDAFSELNEAIQRSPENAQLYASKGRVLVKMQKLWEALDAYRHAVFLGTSDFQIYKEMGDLLHVLQKDDEASDAYGRAIQLSPKTALLFEKRGDIFASVYKYYEALQDYENAIRLSPTNIQPYIKKGDILARRDLHAALQAYENALTHEPKNAQLLRKKGQFHHLLGQLEQAKVAFEQAIMCETVNPDHKAYLYNDYGDLLLKLKAAPEALAAYEDAIRYLPDSSYAYRGKGEALKQLANDAYERLNRLSEQAFDRAKELDNAQKSNGG